MITSLKTNLRSSFVLEDISLSFNSLAIFVIDQLLQNLLQVLFSDLKLLVFGNCIFSKQMLKCHIFIWVMGVFKRLDWNLFDSHSTTLFNISFVLNELIWFLNEHLFQPIRSHCNIGCLDNWEFLNHFGWHFVFLQLLFIIELAINLKLIALCELDAFRIILW